MLDLASCSKPWLIVRLEIMSSIPDKSVQSRLPKDGHPFAIPKSAIFPEPAKRAQVRLDTVDGPVFHSLLAIFTCDSVVCPVRY